MQKTTAKVEHRDYVPHGWVAVEFCRVTFYGFHANEMNRKWEDIENQRYVKYNSLYEENKVKIQNLHSQVDSIHKQIKESKPFFRFWYTKAEKEMLSEANKLLNQAYELEKENEDVEDKMFFDVYECHRKLEEFLQQNGFVLTSASSSGDECVTETEIWTLEE